MSGVGAPSILVSGAGLRVVVVASLWHQTVMDGLVAGAMAALEEAGVESVHLARVAGSFELPVACAKLAKSGKVDALIALGVVIRGGTPHFDYVCDAATIGLTQVSAETAVPIGFGVLTCDTEEQALDRAGLPGSSENKGREAAEAAISTVMELRRVLDAL